jgi:transcriptional antiterminator RfaH
MSMPQSIPENPWASPQWLVVHTLAKQELLAAILLEKQLGATIFLPEVLQYRRGKKQLLPLFPGYLFIQCDLATHPPSAISTVPGVIRLLMGTLGALSVAEEVITSLRQACMRINDSGGLASHFFQPGERVRLLSGPLAGLEGAFVKSTSAGERAIILLRFLNQESPVTVDVHLLETAKEGWRPPRQRSTRGGGRRVNRSA